MGYRLQEVKVNFGYDLKIEAPLTSIEAKQGDILSIPRWIAEVLVDEKLVELQDRDMITALRQATMKENNQGQFNLSELDSTFYIKVNSVAKKLPQSDYDVVESMLNTLIRTRQTKIIELADSSKMTSDIAKKLTIEELVFYNNINNYSKDFKKQILNNKK
jgi:DNA replication factor GINS